MLTDLQCKTASCPIEKRHARFTDACGLYLHVDKNGSKRWFWKYRTSGVEKRIALGAYPDVSLKDARLARDQARAVKSGGQDPVENRKVKKLKESANLADSFRETALEWYEKNKSRWSSHYAIRELRNLEKDLFPFLGERRIGQIETIELLAVIRKVEARGALDVAHRVLSTSRFVWRYGVATFDGTNNKLGDRLYGGGGDDYLAGGAGTLNLCRHAIAMKTVAICTYSTGARCQKHYKSCAVNDMQWEIAA